MSPLDSFILWLAEHPWLAGLFLAACIAVPGFIEVPS